MIFCHQFILFYFLVLGWFAEAKFLFCENILLHTRAAYSWKLPSAAAVWSEVLCSRAPQQWRWGNWLPQTELSWWPWSRTCHRPASLVTFQTQCNLSTAPLSHKAECKMVSSQLVSSQSQKILAGKQHLLPEKCTLKVSVNHKHLMLNITQGYSGTFLCRKQWLAVTRRRRKALLLYVNERYLHTRHNN